MVSSLSVQPLFFVFLFLSGSSNSEKDDRAHGLGDRIDWKYWVEGKALALETGKPLMVVLHKSWCPACKTLKPKFSESDEIFELSRHFVMVNAQEGQAPSNEDYLAPDGGYVPRILFLNSEAELLGDVVNERGNPKYKYFHYEVETIVDCMKLVIKLNNFGGEEDVNNEDGLDGEELGKEEL